MSGERTDWLSKLERIARPVLEAAANGRLRAENRDRQ